MGVAQRLYEGIDVGAEGTTGLITYMRTDSPRVAPEAIAGAREWIGKQLGAQYLPASPNVYKGKKAAQDAHEAIRPTDASRTPESIARYLTEEQLKLYRLIWQRFVASQMMPAIFDVTTIEIAAVSIEGKIITSAPPDRFSLRRIPASLRGWMMKKRPSAGYPRGARLPLATADQLKKLAVEARDAKLEQARKKYNLEVAKIEARNENAGSRGDLEPIPEFVEPEIPLEVRPPVHAVQNFTDPPPRYNEASLVKVLEERGIGRPSTYASIINTIQDREYATKISGRFYPTEIGMVVCDLLVESFPYIFDVAYTAKLEEELDEIEEGTEKWTTLLNGFYGYFEDELKDAGKNMRDIKRMEKKTTEKCDLCGSPLLLKWGKFGSFYACSAYNKKDKSSCTFTKENTAAKPDMNTPEGQEATEAEEYCDNCGRVMVLRRGPFGMFMSCPGFNEDPPCKTFRKLSSKQQQKLAVPKPTGEDCPQCGKPLVLRQGSYGEFVSCSGYPKCKYVKQNLIEGLKCPKCGVGDLAERKARRGNIFWGCTNYPKCDFTSNLKPVAEKCPECGSPYLVEKTLRSGIFLECPNKKKSAEEEAAPKKRAAKSAAKAAAPAESAVVCSYSKRIGDAPPLPTAETHGPVVEKSSEEGRQERVTAGVRKLRSRREWSFRQLLAQSVSMSQRRNPRWNECSQHLPMPRLFSDFINCALKR